MSFDAKAVNIGPINTTLFECPATVSGSVHGLVISNVSAAAVTLTLRFYDHSEGTTILIRSVEVGAKGEYVFPKPINVNPGDRIIASASAGGVLVSLHSVYLSEATPVAKGFTLEVSGQRTRTTRLMTLFQMTVAVLWLLTVTQAVVHLHPVGSCLPTRGASGQFMESDPTRMQTYKFLWSRRQNRA